MSHIIRHSRRHFLAAAGGGLLGVPFLSSLGRRSAWANPNPQRRLIIMGTDHGGVWPENMFPTHGAETVQTLYAATEHVPQHDVRWSALQLAVDGGRARLSNVLEADSGRLTSSLVSKMNVIGGVDISTYVGHNRAAFAGNFAANDQGKSLYPYHVPTIDQVTANHAPFHRGAYTLKSMHFGIRYGVSSSLRGSASSERVNGEVVPVQATGNPRVLWENLFGTLGGGDPATAPVVDLVHEHYRRLTRGAFGDARRLSRADRDRLEAHMTLLAELERKVSVNIQCDAIPQPERGLGNIEELRVAADLYAAAIRCGASNIGVITAAGARISADTGWTNWHEQIAHNGGGDRSKPSFNPEFQRINYRAHRRFFQEVFVRLAEQLDVPEDDEGTFLDRTFMYWAMESGDRTHTNFSVPVVTAGGAGGAVHTGRYLDYRNAANDQLERGGNPGRRPGILLNRFLGNVLQAVGVPPETYHRELQASQPEAFANGTRGYGVREYHPNNLWSGTNLERDIWPAHHFEDGDVPLPGFIRS